MNLPPELIIQIINYNIPHLTLFESITRERTEELLNYCLVNDTFKSIAQPLLFESVSLVPESVPKFLISVQKQELEDKVIVIQISSGESDQLRGLLRELLITLKQVKSLSCCEIVGINGKDLSIATKLECLKLDGGALNNNFYYPLTSLRYLSILSVSSFYHPTLMPLLVGLFVNYSELRALASFFTILGSNLESLAIDNYQFRIDRSEKIAWESLKKLKVLSITPKPLQDPEVIEIGLTSLLNRIPSHQLEYLNIPLIKIMFNPSQINFLEVPCIRNLNLLVLTLSLEEEIKHFSKKNGSPFSIQHRRKELEKSSGKEWNFRWIDVDEYMSQGDGVLFWELVEEMNEKATTTSRFTEVES